MPDFICKFGQFKPLDFILPRFVEETQFDFRGMSRKNCKVNTLAIPERASRVRKAVANLKCLDSLLDNIRLRQWRIFLRLN